MPFCSDPKLTKVFKFYKTKSVSECEMNQGKMLLFTVLKQGLDVSLTTKNSCLLNNIKSQSHTFLN